MPTYDYLCPSCGNQFESFQNMGDRPLETCPACGGPVKRLISTSGGFIVKKKSAQPACGKEAPCCGRSVPCGKSDECR
ncbi:MAG: zinc ribbon domain-containing protein [Spirochaetes bacterium]|nr:zinc ribbon domain-containing protein [Spirochaetota bacterium]